MRVHGDRARGLRARGEGHFGGFDRVIGREAEAEAVDLVEVQRIVRVEDADIHEPFFEVVGRHEGYSRGEGLLNLERVVRNLRIRGIWVGGGFTLTSS